MKVKVEKQEMAKGKQLWEEMAVKGSERKEEATTCSQAPRE